MTQKQFDAIKQVVVIIADGDVDLVQDWCEDAVAHVKDLREMGCKVKIKLFPSWLEAETYVEKLTG